MNFDNLLNPIVTIRGVKTGKYICCNLDGKCFGNKRLEQECYFEEIYTSSRFYVFRPRECQVIFRQQIETRLPLQYRWYRLT